jgi:translation elongation factor EF-G
MSTKIDFNNWLNRISKTEAVSDNIIAFNFGLFESENGYTIYLIGSETFDEEDDDWATNVDFEPKEKYFELNASLVKGKDWQKVLEVSEELVKEYLNSESLHNTIFKKAEAITTGFDDGELVRIK